METELQKELEYFENTESVINTQLMEAARDSAARIHEFSELRLEAEDDINTAIDKEERMMSIALYLTPLAREALAVESSVSREKQLLSAYQNPYFARVDFKRGERARAHYIGRTSIRGENVRDMLVFDWRAPVSSLFYRFGAGSASYDAPSGKIEGEVTLKRQYEIKNAKFEYYFDSDVQIVDEYLRQLLSKNASDKMKAIVETIQRDQDEVIRDMKSDLLMVQGAAGSGKTSIALHRAAFLMYEGLSGRLSANNIAVLSPNRLFEKYIGGVLPELGERSVTSFTFGDVVEAVLGGAFTFRSKFDELESLANDEAGIEDIAYKASAEFAERLKRFAESVRPELRDVAYCGKTVFEASELAEMFAALDESAPLAVRLEKLEELIMAKIRKLRPARIKELERQTQEIPEHAFEVHEYARMLSIAESTELILRVREFTRLDYSKLYFEFLRQPAAAELEFRDAVGIALLKLLLEPCRPFGDVRQVVVDEVQDYDTVHFEILKRLFPGARYTVLGDVNQTVAAQTDTSLYSRIRDTLNVKTSNFVTLSRSFRSTKEILEFASGITGAVTENFGRSGEVPAVAEFNSEREYLSAIAAEIEACRVAGCGSIVLVCKSERYARSLIERLGADVRLLTGGSFSMRGVFAVPVYMAKGLEFDAVLVCGSGGFEPNPLYVACTRALHRLNLFSFSGFDFDNSNGGKAV